MRKKKILILKDNGLKFWRETFSHLACSYIYNSFGTVGLESFLKKWPRTLIITNADFSVSLRRKANSKDLEEKQCCANT